MQSLLFIKGDWKKNLKHISVIQDKLRPLDQKSQNPEKSYPFIWKLNFKLQSHNMITLNPSALFTHAYFIPEKMSPYRLPISSPHFSSSLLFYFTISPLLRERDGKGGEKKIDRKNEGKGGLLMESCADILLFLLSNRQMPLPIKDRRETETMKKARRK